MASVVVELTEEQRDKIRESLGVDSPPTLLVCADSKENLDQLLKSFTVRECTPAAALAE